MAYIATLKKNNTVIYPQTKSTAVYEDDGVTPIDDVVVKKSTAAADANKMIKADGTKALVTESNIDWTESPCVSTFVFSGTQMPTTEQHITKTTKRGTQLTFFMSANSLFIESGADNINKARYSISYRHPNTTGHYGCTGLKTNTTIWSYLTGLSDGNQVNVQNSNSTGDNTYADIASVNGAKESFNAVFDLIRTTNNANYQRWFILGSIISAGSSTALITRCECTPTTIGTIPSWYQRSINATDYYITVEVWED